MFAAAAAAVACCKIIVVVCVSCVWRLCFLYVFVLSVFSAFSLPTKRELNLIYNQKLNIGGSFNFGYWSSTEYYLYRYAYYQQFNDGTHQTADKSYIAYVRAVRAF